MKKIMILLLLMISTNVFAEWTRVGGNKSSNKNGDMTVYIDFETIKKKDNKVKIWTLLDFKKVQKNENDRFLSMALHNEFDCEEDTSRTLDIYSFSGNMRGGDKVYSLSNIKDERKSILPESIEEIIFKRACAKK